MTAATPAPPVAPAPASPETALRRLYLTLFLRGRVAVAGGKSSGSRSIGQRLALVLFVYSLFGLVAFVAVGKPVLILSATLHGTTLFCLSIFLLTSGGDALFNRDEADILLHRPVAAAAILRAKVSVLAQVALWIGGALNLCGLYVGLLASDGDWRFPLVHALSMALAVVFTVAMVVLGYELCLTWIGRDRLESLMTTVQIVFSILAMAAFQFGPRLFRHMTGGVLGELPDWAFVAPPLWFAGLDDALAGSGARRSWLAAAAAVVATILAGWLAFARLAGVYERGLQMAAEPTARVRPPGSARRHADWIGRMPLSWWLGNAASRAAFRLSLAYMLRDREVRLRLYPGVAPIMIIPALVIIDGQGKEGISAFGIAFAGMYGGLVPMLALESLRQSSQWPAAQVFRTAPIAGPGPICHGARRASELLFGLPVLALLVAAILGFDRDTTHLALILPGLLLMPLLSLIPCLDGHAVPLGAPIDAATNVAHNVRLTGVFIAAAGVAGIAALAWKAGNFGWFLLAEAAVVAPAAWLVGRAVDRARWRPVNG